MTRLSFTMGFTNSRRPLGDHLRNGHFHLGVEMALSGQELLFGLSEFGEKSGPIHVRSIAFRFVFLPDNLLAAETTGKTQQLSVRSGQSCRDAVHATDHQAVGIYHAHPVFVAWAHEGGSLPLGDEGSGLGNISGCALHDGIEPFVVEPPDALPQIGPFGIGVVEEITVTAIIRTSGAGQADLVGNNLVLVLHSFVNTADGLGKLGRQKDFFHAIIIESNDFPQNIVLDRSRPHSRNPANNHPPDRPCGING